MTTNYDDKNVWRRICSTTLNNYINMEKRLSDNKKISNFVLIYYSIFLIINSLTPVFFDWYNDKLSDYFGIILSIIMLAYSLINNNANFTQRIEKITHAINALKSLKRNLKDGEIEDFKEKYDRIVDGIEFRSDIDFFYTVKFLCKEKNINCFQRISKIKQLNDTDEEREKIVNYLSELSPWLLQFKIFMNYCLKAVLVVLPIVVVALCVTL